jgi:hypothetical protein
MKNPNENDGHWNEMLQQLCLQVMKNHRGFNE